MLQKTSTNVRIEYLMKMKHEKGEGCIELPDEFMESKVWAFNRQELGVFYHKRVRELAETIISMFRGVHSHNCDYPDLNQLSPQTKTAYILHAELLSLEFGTINFKGKIMKYLNSHMMLQGFYSLEEGNSLKTRSNSKWFGEKYTKEWHKSWIATSSP